MMNITTYSRHTLFVALAVALWLGALVSAQSKPQAPGADGRYNVGRPPTQQELAEWVSISPDGTELPPGKGTAKEGAPLYTRNCVMCHPLSGKGTGSTLAGARSLFNQKPTPATSWFPMGSWPYAPKVWDYLNRAMPYQAPGTLKEDEVYALTAFLLFKEGIIKEDDVMDAKSLPKVVMPARASYKTPPPWDPKTPRGFRIVVPR